MARAPALKQEGDFGKERAGKAALSLNPVHHIPPQEGCLPLEHVNLAEIPLDLLNLGAGCVPAPSLTGLLLVKLGEKWGQKGFYQLLACVVHLRLIWGACGYGAGRQSCGRCWASSGAARLSSPSHPH